MATVHSTDHRAKSVTTARSPPDPSPRANAQVHLVLLSTFCFSGEALMRGGWAQPELTFGEWAEDLLKGMGDVGWTGGLPNALPALLVLVPPQNLLLLTPAAEQVCKSCNGTSGAQSCIQQVGWEDATAGPSIPWHNTASVSAC